MSTKVKTVSVVKGPNATGVMFCFRASAKERIEVGTEPVAVSEEVAAPYLTSGHLEAVGSGAVTPEPAAPTDSAKK